MGSHGDKLPLMKSRQEVEIVEAERIWQKLITDGWQINYPK